MRYAWTILVALLTVGCASQPKTITATYVPSTQYHDYTCTQIAGEVARVNGRVQELNGVLKKKADDDAAQMAIGLILFWPALFFLEGGDGAESVEYSQLKGQYSALEVAAIEKDCAMASNASEGELLEAAQSVSDCGIAKEDLLTATTTKEAEIAALQVGALCN